MLACCAKKTVYETTYIVHSTVSNNGQGTARGQRLRGRQLHYCPPAWSGPAPLDGRLTRHRTHTHRESTCVRGCFRPARHTRQQARSTCVWYCVDMYGGTHTNTTISVGLA